VLKKCKFDNKLKNQNMLHKTALIAGATGLTGSALIQFLIESDGYEKISLIGRKPNGLQHSKIQEIIVDFDTLEDYKSLLVADHVFCCLGTTIKKAKTKAAFKKVDYDYTLLLAKLTKENGAKKFMLVSAMGASEKSIFFYSKVKGAVEKAVGGVGFDALHIFRPSLLLGKRNEYRFGEHIASVLFKMLSWLFVGSLRKYRGIKAETVAGAMIEAAQSDVVGIKIYSSDAISSYK